MQKKLIYLFSIFFGILLSSAVFAEQKEASDVRQVLSQMGITNIEKIIDLNDVSLSAVLLEDGELLYLNKDGTLLIQGNVFSLKSGSAHNITAAFKQQMGKEIFEAVQQVKQVIYSPSAEKKASIVVFTDTECPFCQRFHKLIPELLKQGIEVVYVAYPRSGLTGTAYSTLVNIWCSDDPVQAMDRVKSGRNIVGASCENAVAQDYAWGNKLKIQGTPAILLPSGEVLVGYKDIPTIMGYFADRE